MGTANGVTATVRLGGYSSDRIGAGFFGVNFLADKDSLSGTFHDKASQLGATLIRYPGGGVSESYFDLLRPNIIDSPGSNTTVGFGSFLAHANQTGQQGAFVIPTKRYADDVDQGLSDLRKFLLRLKDGDFGDHRGLIVEIGNEYYADSAPYSRMSAQEYGEIASKFATLVQSIMGESVDISVQTGRTARENRLIQDAFDTSAEREAVDMLTFHEYPWKLEPAAERMDKKAAIADSWSALGVDAEIFLSEWNVGSSGDESRDGEHDYGRAQSSTLLEIATEALKAGVDYAAIWGVQQRTKTALGALEGRDELWAPGKLFSMLQESLPGKRVVDLGANATNSPNLHLYAFEDRAEITVFIAARDLINDQVTVRFNLTGVNAGIANVQADRLSFGATHGAYKVDGVVSQFTPQLTALQDGVRANVTLENDYEIVRLTFNRDMGDVLRQLLKGDSGNDMLKAGVGNDVVLGVQGNDLLIGAGGHDILRGGPQSDRLFGGGGHDVMRGESGQDKLFGADGNDRLFGGDGADLLFGNAGDDRLIGSSGGDQLYGGMGSDWLAGGMGADRISGGGGPDVFVFSGRFGFDLLLDFNPHEDFIDLTGVRGITDYNDLVSNHLGQKSGHARILAEHGAITFANIDPLDLAEANFLF